MQEITLITSKLSKKHKIKELWKYREVITFLSWKDIVVRYKQTMLGILWAIFQPIFSMVIMTFVFGNLANMPVEDGVPYSIMVYAALLPNTSVIIIMENTGWNMPHSTPNIVCLYLTIISFQDRNVITSLYFHNSFILCFLDDLLVINVISSTLSSSYLFNFLSFKLLHIFIYSLGLR